MPELDIRIALTTIERAMVDALLLAYGWRLPEVATIADLKGHDAAPTKDGALRYVLSEGCVYRFRLYSGNAEALPYVVTPAGRTGNGRWERCSSLVTKGPNYLAPLHLVRTGYAKQVILWEGEGGSNEALDRIFASTPAFLIRWADLDVGTRKTAGPYGSVMSYDLTFEIWCCSKNYRPQNQALWGSDLAAESLPAGDPGLNRMIGDVQYLFGHGTQLGLGPGVAQARINGSTKIVLEELDSREFIASVPIHIQASLSIPDEDLLPIQEVWAALKPAGLPVLADGTRGEADLSNYLASGYKILPSAGLFGQPGPGVAYVAGALVSSAPGGVVMPASSDTYRFLLADGSMLYVSTAYDQGHPAGAGLLVGVTRTDSANVVSDAILCGYLLDGEWFRAG